MILALLTSILAQPPAEMVGPPIPQPRVVPERNCRPSDNPDEVVVCGESSENSPYRIPRAFRDQRSDDDVHASWTSRINDEEALARFGDQASGPGGYLQGSRQRECQWRAERQAAQGRRPDCGARNRRDTPTDWQRR